MRICLFSREYPPDTGWGGIGAYTYAHARALKDLGHDVEVIALEAPPDRSHQKVGSDFTSDVVVHRAKWFDSLQELSSLWISVPYAHYVLKCSTALWAEFLRAHSIKPFDVIEAPEHLAEALFPALTRVCPLVIRLHTPHFKFVEERYHNLIPNFDQHVVGMLERIAIQECDVISSPSQSLADYVAKDGGYDSANIEIVRNPVDTQKFNPSNAAGGDSVTVLFVGRLEQRKGVHFLVDAIPQVLKQTTIPVKFMFVGADTKTASGGRSVREELVRSLTESGCLDKVEFVEHVPLTEMPDYYRRADICVLGSLYDNAPCTILEAMACGKPIVGSLAGGIPEYVDHDKTGVLVMPADAAALANAIAKLVQEPEIRSKFGVNALNRVRAEFDRIVVAHKAIATYELARDRFLQSRQKALYRRSPDEAVRDFVSLLCAYQETACNFLYLHSLRFRIKTWLSECTHRPRLFAATRVVALGELLWKDCTKPALLLKLAERVRVQRERIQAQQIDSIVEQFASTVQAEQKSLEQISC